MNTTIPEAFTDPVLLSYRARIAELRDQRNHLIAGIMRDELLCQLEAFIDPAGLVHRVELQTIQGRAAVALALETNSDYGF